MKSLTFGLMLFLTGCASYTYSDPQGRSLKIVKVGTNTQIGSLEAHTSNGDSLKLSTVNVDAAAAFQQVSQAMQKVADLLNTLKR